MNEGWDLFSLLFIYTSWWATGFKTSSFVAELHPVSFPSSFSGGVTAIPCYAFSKSKKLRMLLWIALNDATEGVGVAGASVAEDGRVLWGPCTTSGSGIGMESL